MTLNLKFGILISNAPSKPPLISNPLNRQCQNLALFMTLKSQDTRCPAKKALNLKIDKCLNLVLENEIEKMRKNTIEIGKNS